MAGWNHDSANWKAKKCVCCGGEFQPKSGAHKFCSDACKGRWKYISGLETTETQYRRISGNWRRYYLRLLGRGDRRNGLTIESLMELHKKQNGLCALSGIPLTCDLKKGSVCRTNSSVDRIIPGGPYTKDNIQLVCKSINSWRGSTPLEEFVEICRLIALRHPKRSIDV